MGDAQGKRLSEVVRRLRPFSSRSFGNDDVVVSSVTEDSRNVRPGSLFVARRGVVVDGRRYVDDAFERGAAAVLCTPRCNVPNEPRIEVDELQKAWGSAAQFLAGDPSERLSLIGVTGTNGKTTVASLVAQALLQGVFSTPRSVARLGTLGFFVGDELVNESLTTPQPDGLAAALATCVERGADTCVMEVSSHALAQHRTHGVCFSTVAFTNLSQDHLDYHGSLEEYAAAKYKLFTDYPSKHVVLNVADPHGKKLKHLVNEPALTVSVDPQSQAALKCHSARFDLRGTSAALEFRQSEQTRQAQLTSPLIGAYNLENLLVALGILLAEGADFERAVDALAHARPVPGRMERCETEEDDIVVVVDYAHTPDALVKALDALRALDPAELICVFGCGGDRDRKKRPEMARAVAERADAVWLTSDNPRSEDPERILDDASQGLVSAAAKVHRQAERRKAIETAVVTAPPGSIVLVAGKGHETYQLVGDRVLSFDDRQEVRRGLVTRRQRKGGLST